MTWRVTGCVTARSERAASRLLTLAQGPALGFTSVTTLVKYLPVLPTLGQSTSDSLPSVQYLDARSAVEMYCTTQHSF